MARYEVLGTVLNNEAAAYRYAGARQAALSVNVKGGARGVRLVRPVIEVRSAGRVVGLLLENGVQIAS